MLSVMLPLTGAARPLEVPPADAGTRKQPNIVLIVADDLDSVDLRLFPNIYAQIVRQGATFDNFFTANPWCCPSRSTILRSQYVHSHGVLTNTAPEGGFAAFHEQDLERSTIGTWLQQAGYRTALMGKYLNHYPGAAASPSYVPPGWDEWHVPVKRLYEEYGYTLNENGVLREYGLSAEDYLSDVLTAKAADFIVAGEDPFFLYLTPIAPHRPANPAPRHADAFAGLRAPRTPAFDQEETPDEPAWLRALPRLSEQDIETVDELYRRRLRAMLGVDDMVGALVETLRATGKLDDTYLIFTSDNGFHLGTRRLVMGKTTPYEESIRVPMAVRGPGVEPGITVRELAATVDLGPTLAELAGAQVPAFAEGRSLVPLFDGRADGPWRKRVLIEFYRGQAFEPTRGKPVPPYRALRTERYTYVEYATGDRQLFDLYTDPFQLDNIVTEASPRLVERLARDLERMASCSGAECRTADS